MGIRESWRAEPGPDRGSELAQSTIYIICAWLGSGKGTVLLKDPKLQDLHDAGQPQDRWENPRKDPALALSQKLEIWNRTDGLVTRKIFK